MYKHETIRDAIITTIQNNATTQAVFYRQPVSAYDSYPAFILEYAENQNQWASSQSDKRIYMFNLYVAYAHENDDTSREEAEKNISNALGELYNDDFSDPDVVGMPSGWLRASDTSWGYGADPDVPIRMAMLQIEVTVHEDR